MAEQNNGQRMEYVYRSRYGTLIKRPGGICEYWYKGQFVATWYDYNAPPPDRKPTSEEWAFCVEVRDAAWEE